MREDETLSMKRAIELWDNEIIDTFEIGSTKGLKQIHYYLFQDLFTFAGIIRDQNISKGNFRFAGVLFLEDILKRIDEMPHDTLDRIIDKYVEMNIAHPFREGNGRATRIWLDLMLKSNIKACVDWSQIEKSEYLSAMERSPVNCLEIQTLIMNNLTTEYNNRLVYMKGIEQSYMYERSDDEEFIK